MTMMTITDEWQLRCPECLRCFCIYRTPKREPHCRDTVRVLIGDKSVGTCPDCNTTTKLVDMIMVEHP